MKNIQMPTGRVAYRRTGQGPAVLLVQGVGLVGEGWRPQIDGLADRFTLVSFDNPGIGQSELRANAALTIEGMASTARAIMDEERIVTFHLAGHSMGGLIAQSLALSAPERVKSLSLLCTFAHGRQASSIKLGMLGTALRTHVGTAPMRRNAFLSLVMPKRYLAGVDRAALARQLEPLFGYDLANRPPIATKQLSAMSKFDVSAQLASLAAIPTMVISASDDRIALPAYGRGLARAIPGAKYVEVAGAGHGVVIQRAAEINRLLADHLLAAECLHGTPADLASGGLS